MTKCEDVYVYMHQSSSSHVHPFRFCFFRETNNTLKNTPTHLVHPYLFLQMNRGVPDDVCPHQAFGFF